MKIQFLIGLVIAIMFVGCNSSDNTDNIDFAKDYPNADAVYLTMTKEYVLNEDGSVDYTYSHSQKLLTHIAFNRLYGESFVVYNPNEQVLTINKAETKMVDGVIVPSPDNAFNEVLPHGAADAPAYNHLREMVITHTGLEVGAIIDFSYTLHSNAGYYPAFMGYESISKNSPIRELNVIIKVPEGKELKFSNFNCELDLKETLAEGQKVYTFTLKDIAPRPGESKIAENTMPSFIFSTENVEDLNKKFVSQDAFKFEGNEAIDKYIAENKISGMNIENALHVQEYVVKNINNYHLSLNETAYKHRTPAEVWQSNGGTEIEKTILLATLLKKYGYNASPIGICENYAYDYNIGVIDIFTEFVVRIEMNNEYFYLSAMHSNDQNLKFNLEQKSVINLENLSEKTIVDEKIPNNELKVSGELTISDKKLINGNLNAFFSGECNQYYKLVQDLNSAKSMLSGFTIFNSDIESNSSSYSDIYYEIKEADAFKNQANYYFLQLPKSTTGIASWHLDFLASERVSNFKVPYAIKEEYAYRITIPEGMTLVSTLADINQANNIGIILISITKEENILTIYRKIEINKMTEIDAENYQDFRNMINAWNNKKFSEIIFKEI